MCLGCVSGVVGCLNGILWCLSGVEVVFDVVFLFD